MQPVGDLARELHRLGATHRSELERNALLHGPRSGRHARVTEEVSVEVDRALVEQFTDDATRLAQPRDRASAAPLDPVLLEHREIADPHDDLDPAAAELVQRGGKLSDIRGITQVD